MPGQPSASDDHPYLNLLIKNDQLLDPEPSDDGINLKVDEYPWGREDNAVETPVAGPKIEGPPELQRQLKELLEEFPDIFGAELRAEPADLTHHSLFRFFRGSFYFNFFIQLRFSS